jgi:hypothetical protein
MTYDIKFSIAVATKAFGALTKFWYNQHVDTYSKYLIFRALPLSYSCGDAKLGPYGNHY